MGSSPLDILLNECIYYIDPLKEILISDNSEQHPRVVEAKRDFEEFKQSLKLREVLNKYNNVHKYLFRREAGVLKVRNKKRVWMFK